MEVLIMPNITLEGPAITDLNKKRVLVQQVTALATEAYGLPPETIVVVIKENGPENVAVGGILALDRL